LRALTIHKLTEKVLDPSCPPAQQIKAMELLGKITEVALFTERREVIQHNTSDQMKEKLLSSLRLAISSQGVTDVTETDPESLLAELTAKPISMAIDSDYVAEDDVSLAQETNEPEAEGFSDQFSARPTTPQPPFLQNLQPPLMHSNPHNQSTSIPQPIDSPQVSCVTPVTSRVNPNVTEGEGGTNIPVDDLESELRTPPVNVSKS
jgi:hypothetical protein